ncbi:zinc finger protein 267-like [Wyeomyia smithii]|uniref:zinc finger protein 267-like n=1 Tax=Wyeomyia smithii TaxID=174621 RepID=UPI00246813F6|nr:zinc finger protein 267-like [Wyeomyia smithii]
MDCNLQEILEDLSTVDAPSMTPNFSAILEDLTSPGFPTPEPSPTHYDQFLQTITESCAPPLHYATLTPAASPVQDYDATMSEGITAQPRPSYWLEIANSTIVSYIIVPETKPEPSTNYTQSNSFYQPDSEQDLGLASNHETSFMECPSSGTFAIEYPTSSTPHPCEIQGTSAQPFYITWSIVSPTEETISVEIPPANSNENSNEGQLRKSRRVSFIQYNTELYCMFCNKEFGRKGNLRQHILTQHSSDRLCRCEICGKNFATEEKLQNHKRNHDPENKKYPCSQCEKSYVYPKDRDRHFDLHHGTPMHQCKYCRKRFVRRDHLLAHEQSHEKQGTIELTRGRRRRKVPGGNGVLLPLN